MRWSGLKWWQWLLAGSLSGAVAIIAGPVADRHGYGTFAGLIVSMVAWVGWAVCWVVGFVRFVRWAWSSRKST